MIVKNEEDLLEKSLREASRYVDEVIVVDNWLHRSDEGNCADIYYESL